MTIRMSFAFSCRYIEVEQHYLSRRPHSSLHHTFKWLTSEYVYDDRQDNEMKILVCKTSKILCRNVPFILPIHLIKGVSTIDEYVEQYVYNRSRDDD